LPPPPALPLSLLGALAVLLLLLQLISSTDKKIKSTAKRNLVNLDCHPLAIVLPPEKKFLPKHNDNLTRSQQNLCVLSGAKRAEFEVFFHDLTF
jgi:hypothetical protein